MSVLDVIAWLLIVMAPVNVYVVWHGWRMNRSVDPRSPVLRALLWVEFSLWLLNVYFAIVAFRFLNGIDPVMPFGGFGLGLSVLFVLSVPAVIHWQMRQFVQGDDARNGMRDEARDSGRDEVRDPARDIARDAEHDATEGP